MRFKNQQGMTLIEIAVVLAILGILASIGVTKYGTLQKRQRNAQAKAQLGALHARMSNFQTEWDGYWGLFRDIGYSPAGVLIYDIGFRSAGPAPANFTAVGAAGQYNTRSACGPGNDITNCSVAPAPNLSVGGNWNATTFSAGAEGNIGGNQTDQWTINQVKVLDHIRDGAL